MASSELSQALTRAAASSANRKQQAYQDLLQQITSTKSDDKEQLSANLVAYDSSLLSDSALGVIGIRPLLASVIQFLNGAPSEVKISVGSHLVDALQPQVASFEERDASVRDILALGYEQEEDFSQAAKALQGIHLETTQRQVSDLVKAQIGIRIVRLYLEDDDTVAAETALNKIKNSATAQQIVIGSPDLHLHYQLSQARIHDSRRDFLNASAEYYNVSLSGSVEEGDRLQALSAAIKTAVLAPAGPQRGRTLGKLYKDERSTATGEHSILENMFLDRLLAPAEVEAFAATLAPHQLAQAADGSTVLSKAIIEHNLLAASRLYENISTTALAEILGLKGSDGETAAEKAQDYAARMVEQQRLKASIDQIEGVITFQAVPGVELQGSERQLRVWDIGVQGVVEDVERCATVVSESFPELLVEQMVH